jgi:hypothetical protein
MDTLFRFLFKYPPLMFHQGDLTWGLSRPVMLIVVAALALAAGRESRSRSAVAATTSPVAPSRTAA